ncbi:acyltransferase family protein [Mameliella alba]|uniref:acyltransferase family protein n=1 Tax=Mameliella alba TaxID=561184 RepID=UPI000B532D85|nr:acyltransferase [Mameliella alba]MBY6120697.1 acyltransferase [Mameliella alba]OWV42999.1 hypothetical protein CDZ95_12870 [Mameliella alba]OWV63668.1 hypothetical protein CDZ97_14350 [Mameliella alba]
MKYRPEVDGLRAVAVLPVILYHAGSEVFSGGFVGVDVFFVISGYLITGLLLEDMDEGRFSLWRFYERRARRILPALIAVILPCLVLGWFVMLPDPYENLGQSVVATLVFGNNLLVYLTSGYWGPVGEFRPLLHTWSLGVEEQFYVLAPLALFAVWRVARGYLLQTVLLLWGISLARNLSLTWTDWDYAFLMIDTRAWQLLTGAAVLLAERRGWLAGNGWLACAGLVAIGVSVFGFSVDVPYPGYAALLPTLGAAAVIGFSGAGSPVGRLLSLAPLVGIGLISYSLYLWHQPVFAFTRILSHTEPPLMLLVALLGPVFVLAWLSWRFVETPFRDRSRVPVPILWRTLGGASVLLLGVGLATYQFKGFPARMVDLARFEPADVYRAYNTRIFGYRAHEFEDNNRPDVLVIGNSQARDFINILIEGGYGDSADIVYRDDYFLCDPDRQSAETADLLQRADGLIFVTYWLTEACWDRVAASGLPERPGILFVGPKVFGYNLNVFGRVPPQDRPQARVQVLPETVDWNDWLRTKIPEPIYLDILRSFSKDGKTLPVFDANGTFLSGDRTHVTRAGAVFMAGPLLDTPQWRRFRDALDWLPD